MATLLLSAAGAAIGGGFGGAILGISGAVIGKAVGATVGAVIDQRLLGKGSDAVEVGRVDRFRVMGASEGAPLTRSFGRMRVAGSLIWSTRFKESVSTSSGGGGKGAPSQPQTKSYSYSVSLAIALVEGEVTRIGRVWADGQQISIDTLNWRLYPGNETQLPDPLIEAVEGAGDVPAYRGTAYVVIEDLPLSSYGNRIPQFNFEVFRRPEPANPEDPPLPAELVQGVAMVPGTGEYSLATTPVDFDLGKGVIKATNINNDRGRADFAVAMEHLTADLPKCGAVSLVVSWFGDDLRLDRCTLRPKVEQNATDGTQMPWTVSGLDRGSADVVSALRGRPRFGGTPSDQSVVEAIQHIHARGQEVLFYPFILMDIAAANGLTDPWTGASDQPEVPWRGRITTSMAPGQIGSPDGLPAATAEVAGFFGAASPADFVPAGQAVGYSGTSEWSYRRFILHYAHLCALAGGVEAFCIGSEMRAMTQVRDGAQSFPSVAELKALAADVRAILGTGTKIGYAADWSEYFGYRPTDGSGDVLYHLDPLWSDANIDFVGIDNYMPLSDWRDGEGHLDDGAGTIYDLAYLKGNVAGGEGYDWYYESDAARAAQKRLPITDGSHQEPYVFRYKDILNWWNLPHWNRPGGVRDTSPTSWVPQSKPIWFTELGCPAVDKGTNQPNVFSDPDSSEDALPYFSSGAPDEYIQIRYLQAMYGYWQDPANNPTSLVYDAPMVDMSHAFVWAWDARPWPDFPARLETWSDGPNYLRGHWLSGRTGSVPLADVVREISARAGDLDVDVTDLHGVVKGYVIDGTETARQSLQPLMLAHAFDSTDQAGTIVFRNRRARVDYQVDPDALVVESGKTETLNLTRTAKSEVSSRVRVDYVQADLGYQTGSAEVQRPGVRDLGVSKSEMRMALSDYQAEETAARWLTEAEVARDEVTLRLPVSALAVEPGDILEIPGSARGHRYRVDRVDTSLGRSVEAVRMEYGVFGRPVVSTTLPATIPTPIINRGVYAEFLDLPLLSGNEIEHAPHVAATATPWPGPVAVYTSASTVGYQLDTTVALNATMGVLTAPLSRSDPARFSQAEAIVQISSGTLQSLSRDQVLNGGNVAALRAGGTGDWEVIQFETATPVATGQYRLGGLLRGQAGTDGIMPDVWPAGTDFVLLDGSAEQLSLPTSALGLDRHYRVGPASKPYDDPTYSYQVEQFQGVGLRPYAPAHLRAVRQGNGDIDVTWIRRTRIDGDAWRTVDVPLGEARESYEVRVVAGSTVVRQTTVSGPAFSYSDAQQTADGLSGPVRFEVAQISDRVGAGPFAGVDFNG